MREENADMLRFAGSLVIGYYAIVLIGVAWDVALLILKSVVAGWIVP